MSENQIILRTSCWTLTCIDLLIYKTINVQGGSDPLPTINRGNLAFRTFKTYLNLGISQETPLAHGTPFPCQLPIPFPHFKDSKTGMAVVWVPCPWGSLKIFPRNHVSSVFKKNRGWLGYLGDYTSHLYRDCSKYNKPTNKGSLWNQPVFHGMSSSRWVLITAYVGIPIIENKSPWHSGPHSFRTWKPASPHTKMGHPERVVYLPSINFQSVR